MSQKHPANLTQPEKSILETLCYFAVFNYPISFYKICAYSKVSDVNEATHALQALVDKNLVVEKNGLYLLHGLHQVEVNERTQNSLQALELAHEASRILQKIPWIRLLAVTGSVAALNKTEEDDIDVFIIAQNHRLWITRFFVFLLLKTVGLYRTELNSKNKICTNLFVDETSSTWENNQSIYVAHEIVTMFPLINKKNAYFTFLTKNKWVCDFYPNFAFFEVLSTQAEERRNLIMNAFEKFFCKLQILYMQPKKTTETVLPGFVHFNKKDSKDEILANFLKLKAYFVK